MTQRISGRTLFTCFCGQVWAFGLLKKRGRSKAGQFDFLCPDSACSEVLASGSIESGISVSRGILFRNEESEKNYFDN